MDHFIIGTAGHIDHGKTSLVRALTGTDTDTLKEEQERKITIDIGFAFLGDDTTIIDVPGHEKFIKNMVAGVSTIDFVILVIAADDGVMPQTREHLDIIKLLDIRDGMVVVTKSDMVEEDWLELVMDDISEFVSDTFLGEKSIVAVDSLSGKNIDTVLAEIRSGKERRVERGERGVFRLPVDRVFVSKGHGTIVTGTILSGMVNEGDLLKVQPVDKEVRVRGLECHGNKATSLKSGDRAAINLHGVSKDDIHRGNIVTSPGYLKPVYMFESNLFILNSAKEIKNRERVRVHAGTSEVLGRVYILDKESIMPGESGLIQIRLEEQISISIGDRFVLRTYSPQVTIGGGKVVTTSLKKIKTSDEDKINLLNSMGEVEPEEFLEKIILSKGDLGINAKDLAVEVTYELDDCLRFIKGLTKSGKAISDGKVDNPYMIHNSIYNRDRDLILNEVEGFHKSNTHKPGLPKVEVKSLVNKRSSQPYFELILKVMVANGDIKISDNIVSLTDFTPNYSDEIKKAMDSIYNYYNSNGFSPQSPSEIFSSHVNNEKQFFEVVSILSQGGRLRKISDIIYITDQGFEKLITLLKSKMEANGEIVVKDISEGFDTSRKFTIPILEYLDRNSITRREGDIRVLA